MRKTVNVQGLGFSSVLALIFITLKLTRTITWDWVWVLSPIWISAGLAVIILLVFAILYVFFSR